MQQTIEQRIAGIKSQIASIEADLPYADHGAYSQDKQRLSRLRGELARLQSQREAAHADPQPQGR